MVLFSQRGWLVLLVFLLPNYGLSCLNLLEQKIRIGIKRFIYSGLTSTRYAARAEHPPLVQIKWSDTVLLHWRIRADTLASFQDELPLPFSARLVPVPLLEEVSAADYILSLIVKQVDDDHLELEWWTYITVDLDSGASSKPFVLVVDSFTTANDAINPLGKVQTASLNLRSRDAWEFLDRNITLPLAMREAEIIGVSRHLVGAFRRLYYSNGVYTSLFLDGSMYETKALLDTNRSADDLLLPRWAGFVESTTPVATMYFPEPVSVGAELWTNAEEEALLEARSTLHDAGETTAVLLGKSEPTALISVTDKVPSYFAAFEIMDPEALVEHVNLPGTLELAPMRIRENGPSSLMLVLNVYQAAIVGISDGVRAEWSVFVVPKGSTNESPRFLVVEAVADAGSFDPVNLFTRAATAVEHTDDGTTTRTSYVREERRKELSFALSYPTPPICNNTVSMGCDSITIEHLVANDEIFWLNGVYDRVFYNDIANIPLRVVDPAEISFDLSQSGWCPFVSLDVLDFFVFNPSKLLYFLNPMFNVEEIQCTLCDHIALFC